MLDEPKKLQNPKLNLCYLSSYCFILLYDMEMSSIIHQIIQSNNWLLLLCKASDWLFASSCFSGYTFFLGYLFLSHNFSSLDYFVAYRSKYLLDTQKISHSPQESKNQHTQLYICILINLPLKSSFLSIFPVKTVVQILLQDGAKNFTGCSASISLFLVFKMVFYHTNNVTILKLQKNSEALQSS